MGTEQGVDLIVSSAKSLSMMRRLEALHHPLSWLCVTPRRGCSDLYAADDQHRA